MVGPVGDGFRSEGRGSTAGKRRTLRIAGVGAIFPDFLRRRGGAVDNRGTEGQAVPRVRSCGCDTPSTGNRRRCEKPGWSCWP